MSAGAEGRHPLEWNGMELTSKLKLHRPRELHLGCQLDAFPGRRSKELCALLLCVGDNLGTIRDDELLGSLEHFCGFWEQLHRVFAIEILGKAKTYGGHSFGSTRIRKQSTA